MYIVCSIYIIYIIYIYVVQKTYKRVGTNYYYYIIYMHNLCVKEDDGRGNRKLLMIAKLLYESWIIISGKR